MNNLFKRLLLALVLSAASIGWASPQAGANPPATIRSITVAPDNGGIELEIVGSGRLEPQTKAITGPDRLVIDLPNAVPASTVRNLAVNRGEVKSVRVARYSDNPPTTRVVVDLTSPLPYQVFPSANGMIVKLSGGGAALKNVAATKSATPMASAPAAKIVPAVKSSARNLGFTTNFEVVQVPTITPPPAPPRVQVTFLNGNLTILANKATLSEVLYEVQKKTGADIGIPSGSEREQVSANFGPGPAREILSSMLNGSNFNFIMIADDNDPSKLRSVILSPKGAPMVQPGAVRPAVPPNTAAQPVPSNTIPTISE